MAFKVGDKVKYNSGDWVFFGSISAVIENSISPCYRLTVERMIKMNCKFSITQFEFELTLENGIEPDVKQIHEVASKEEVIKVIEQENENPPRQVKVGAWERNLTLFQKGERSNAIYTWMNRNRRMFKSNKLPKEKLDILKSINFPFESSKKRNK